MVHERVASKSMPPAEGGGTQAEIVLLAVADGETFRVEVAHLAQSFPADVHAEADGCRQVDGAPEIGLAACLVDPLNGMGKYRRSSRVAWITADRGVIGKRRDSGDSRLRIGLRRQPAQPVGRDLGVTVQQYRHHGLRLPSCLGSPKQRNRGCRGSGSVRSGPARPAAEARRREPAPASGRRSR